MRKFVLPIVLFGLCMLVFATQKSKIFDGRYTPSLKIIYYKLGNIQVPLKVQEYGKKSKNVFISLHDDEYTSVEATKRLLEKTGGLLIEIENNEKRNIRFRLGNQYYSIDPNRMFSDAGISKSLTENGRNTRLASNEVRKFAERLLELIPEQPKMIVALHNNTHGQFSIQSYAKGSKRNIEAEKININEQHDEDDFFLTTDGDLYKYLASKNFNVVLQKKDDPVDDGSLSIYCGKQGLPYVNLETEHGKMDVYSEMMRVLLEGLD